MRTNKFSALLPLLIIIGFNACSVKESACADKTVESEQAAILSYAAAQGITPTAHSTGLYYQIINPGSGPTPTLTSRVFVKYTGKLLNGTIFDQQTAPVSYGLGGMILGFQIGLPLIQKGGIIKIIVPSALAYGCRGYGLVPGNSILFFEIELTDVQ